MNRQSIIAAAVLASAAASAFAIEAEQFVPEASPSLTRAEVRAELDEAMASGVWHPVNEAGPTPKQAAEWDRYIAVRQLDRAMAQAAAAQPEVVSEAPVREDELIAMGITQGSLPFDHPAIHARPSTGS